MDRAEILEAMARAWCSSVLGCDPDERSEVSRKITWHLMVAEMEPVLDAVLAAQAATAGERA
jgi:hypothetical protein